ncbi:D-lactate dehydrogenase [cytochrome] [Kluyveromyces marxianus]|uniref:D-lactate dehydrogenase (cytochrome) n=1 Tax=Kluyveromyces marxianus TaxID=4911 RepID=A0ABX6EYN0_KLUMA|nr:D-lactate dehydrogenase [Kluyveromyces marxianus]BAP72413.1 D-lactate dehydrogenase [cytochrome] [Kluyveromyces marxianus]
MLPRFVVRSGAAGRNLGFSFTRKCDHTFLSKTVRNDLSHRPYSTGTNGNGSVNANGSANAGKSQSGLLFGVFGGTLIGGGLVAYFLGSKFDQQQSSSQQVSDLSIARLEDLDSPKYCDKKTFATAVEELKQVLDNNPENFSDAKSDLDSHSDTYFNSHHATPEQRPEIVLFPRNTEDVSKLLKICHKYSIPVIPFSGGTSLEGHFMPTRPGSCVVLDISKYMNQIIQLNKEDLDVVVQGGVPWEDLNDYLNDHGLLFGCDPGPGAQIAGCIANSCSGTNAYRYGTMKENVVNITMCLADGTIIKTKRRPRKSSAGYNLNGLIIGSEGTLGIVTEATIKCHVRSNFETVAVVPFPSVADAASCSSHLIQAGIQLNAMELLDDNMMKIINKSGATSRTNWVESPTLFFKIGGRSEKAIKEVVKEVEKIASQHNNSNFEFASDEETKLELWEARKVALWSTIDAGKKLDPNVNVWTTDVAVPISKFAQVINDTKEEMNASGLLTSLVGHAGDGNFHAFIIYNAEQRKTAETIVENMVKRAIDAEGTCTGEHGVGIGKREFLVEELGEDTIAVMRKLKLALDPKRILNPDKVFKIDPNDHQH